jgi:predicted aminopeptidase
MLTETAWVARFGARLGTCSSARLCARIPLGGRGLRLALASLALSALGGCASTLYLVQAGAGEWHVMHDRKPIVQVIDDPATPEAVVRELGEVRAARKFASAALGLPDNESYRTYVDIHRPYVVWNVVAAPALSVVPKHWCFPIAGCVAYRGYFNEKRARAFARELKSRDYDVVVEGVPAYSTLGKLPDPVMSTMLRFGTDELAAMIFHELAHQLLYVRNDSRFDEAFAVTVENVGLKRWLERRGEAKRIAAYEKEQADEQQFVQLLRRTRERLAELYGSQAPRARKLHQKAEVFSMLADEIRALERRLGVHSPLYDRWIETGLNNADLASVATYYDCVPGFERLLASAGGSLPRFYAAARRLAGEPRSERDAQLCEGYAATAAPNPRAAVTVRPAARIAVTASTVRTASAVPEASTFAGPALRAPTYSSLVLR